MDPNISQASSVNTPAAPIDPEIQQLSQSTEIDPTTIPTHSSIMKFVIWGIVIALLMLSSGSVGFLVGVQQTEMKLVAK